jgi:hypothetical protein
MYRKMVLERCKLRVKNLYYMAYLIFRTLSANETNLYKKVIFTNTECTRRVGSPLMRFLETAKQDLRRLPSSEKKKKLRVNQCFGETCRLNLRPQT